MLDKINSKLTYDLIKYLTFIYSQIIIFFNYFDYENYNNKTKTLVII